jgi:DNA-binding transcriptional regulator YhcF (GntR family)
VPVRPSRRGATSVEDAIAFVRREMASERAFAPGFALSVRILAKRTPCARQTAMLALQRLRDAGVVALEDGGAYRVRDPELVRTSRAEELDQLVAADLRRLYDRGFSVEEIRESYQRKLPSSFLQRGPH